MKNFDKYVKLIDNITKTSEEALFNSLSSILKAHGYSDVRKTANYIYAAGTTPVGLVAHTDTVQASANYYDEPQKIMFTECNGGYDDRAGVAMILAIIMETKLRPTIFFTRGEETGAWGAQALAKEVNPANLKYLIELDRAGFDDAVFYQCANKSFTSYILSFGFQEQIGTFTDIYILCPAWGIAGVNLSIGYYYEHTPSEYLNLEHWYETLLKVKKLLASANKSKFYKFERRVQNAQRKHR